MILIILLIIFAYNLFFLKKTINTKGFLIITFSLFVNIFYISLYRFELSNLNRLVYYSDAEYYYLQAINLLTIGIQFFNDYLGYNYIVYLTLKYGLFRNPFELNIVNLLFLYNGVFFAVRYMKNSTHETINKKAINFIFLFIFFNPLITFSLFRNLKDAYFFFFVGLLLFFNSQTNIPNSIKLILNAALTLYLPTIRPWAFVLPFTIFILEKQAKNPIRILKKSWITIILPIVIFVLLYTLWQIKGDYILTWINYLVNKDAGGNEGKVGLDVIDKLLGPIRLILGPGPFRPLFPEQYFKYYMQIGNILTEIGICFWYLFLSLIIVEFRSLLKLKIKSYLPLLFTLSCYLIIYAFAYAGAVEIRFRGQIFPLLIIYLFSIDANYIRITKTKTFPIFIIFMILTIISIVISI